MKIDQYISDLLYDHDCVIVTDLGGFIANYRPASINPALHVVSPPSKKLAFNGSLKNNDGLLANYVSQRSRLSYSEACEIISEYVKDAVQGMRTGQKLKIDKVGVLYFDNEERLQFLPDHNANYLLDSFGMSPVHAPLIRRQVAEISEKRSAAITEKHDIGPFRPNSGKKRWSIIEMIPAAAVLVILLITPPALQEINTNLSTLLPFSRINEFFEEVKGQRPEKVPVVIPYKNPFEIPPIHSKHLHNISSPGTTNNATQPAVVPAKEITTVKAEPTAPVTEVKSEPESIPVSEVKTSDTPEKKTPDSKVVVEVGNSRYHIIGGCFRSSENAEKFIQILKEKNIEASIIGQNKAGLFLVSLQAFHKLDDANSTLPEMKSKVEESLWIYKK